MVDNFNDTVNALRRFIYANVPEGLVGRIERIEHQTNYFPLEFRRADVSCTLYIHLDGFAAESFKDDEGNRWRTVKLRAEPSWPSYGSVDVDQAARFLALISDVVTFARAILAEFSEPITQLVETADVIATRKQTAAVEKCRHDVQALMRANVKGMRVGQERRVEVSADAPDLLPVGHVTFCDGPRQYTTHVTATRTFCVMRTA